MMQPTPRQTLRVFCDFDGTISTRDVGDEIFKFFVGEEATRLVNEYRDDEITARECLKLECEAVDSCSPDQLEKFISQFTLDPHFKPFVEFCEERQLPIVVLSDGLDFYVSRLLADDGLDRVPWYANHLEFVIEGSKTKLLPSFPYTDSECHLCGNCKRNHLLTLSADEDLIVYIGDGISDRCPVRYADIVFAKHSLIKYCQAQNISYFPYTHFGDVQERLASILRHKRIKKRREAEMARRDVFMQG